jgi:hypothetical protein
MNNIERIKFQLKSRKERHYYFEPLGGYSGRSRLEALKRAIEGAKKGVEYHRKIHEKLSKNPLFEKVFRKLQSSIWKTKPDCSYSEELEALTEGLGDLKECTFWYKLVRNISEMRRYEKMLEYLKAQIPKEEDKLIRKYLPNLFKRMKKDEREKYLELLKKLGCSEID